MQLKIQTTVVQNAPGSMERPLEEQQFMIGVQSNGDEMVFVPEVRETLSHGKTSHR